MPESHSPRMIEVSRCPICEIRISAATTKNPRTRPGRTAGQSLETMGRVAAAQRECTRSVGKKAAIIVNKAKVGASLRITGSP